MIAYMFPGQGSQHTGMGSDLFARFPELVHSANRILGYSIDEVCLEPGAGRLNQTQYTQPALFVVNALCWLARREEVSGTPRWLMGHSVGEYNALFAAGVFDFDTGLRLVKRRAQLMAEASGGGMAAVIGVNAEEVRRILRSEALDDVDLANLNSPTQVVISGPLSAIRRAEPAFLRAGVRAYIPLPVSGAFHSRYMQSAGIAFERFLELFDFAEPTATVVSNVEARPYTERSVRRLLAEQITKPVNWVGVVEYSLAHDVREFEELGPGRVLTKLVSQIQGAGNAESRVPAVSAGAPS